MDWVKAVNALFELAQDEDDEAIRVKLLHARAVIITQAAMKDITNGGKLSEQAQNNLLRVGGNKSNH